MRVPVSQRFPTESHQEGGLAWIICWNAYEDSWSIIDIFSYEANDYHGVRGIDGTVVTFRTAAEAEQWAEEFKPVLKDQRKRLRRV